MNIKSFGQDVLIGGTETYVNIVFLNDINSYGCFLIGNIVAYISSTDLNLNICLSFGLSCGSEWHKLLHTQSLPVFLFKYSTDWCIFLWNLCLKNHTEIKSIGSPILFLGFLTLVEAVVLDSNTGTLDDIWWIYLSQRWLVISGDPICPHGLMDG